MRTNEQIQARMQRAVDELNAAAGEANASPELRVAFRADNGTISHTIFRAVNPLDPPEHHGSVIDQQRARDVFFGTAKKPKAAIQPTMDRHKIVADAQGDIDIKATLKSIGRTESHITKHSWPRGSVEQSVRFSIGQRRRQAEREGKKVTT